MFEVFQKKQLIGFKLDAFRKKTTIKSGHSNLASKFMIFDQFEFFSFKAQLDPKRS